VVADDVLMAVVVVGSVVVGEGVDVVVAVLFGFIDGVKTGEKNIFKRRKDTNKRKP